jgi:hypothetical protein
MCTKTETSRSFMATQSTRPSQFAVVKSLAIVASLAALGIPGWVYGQTNPCANTQPPPGAQSLGYVHRVFCVEPTTSDVSDSPASSSAKLSTWIWYSKNPSAMSLYSMSGQTLVIASGGGLNTQTHQSQPGALPLLPASAGFYVEFAERLSDNDPDHFPAVWLMPQEHNGRHQDHMAGDPSDYERWVELDVDEGGFNGGHHGAMINWYGTYPQYQHKNFSNDPPSTFGMDRTQEHIFGLSYDPAGKKVTWWVDGVAVGGASTESLPSTFNSHHYYLIMGAQNHGLNHPYKMYLPYFSAWSTGVPPNPPSGVKAETVP